MILRAFGLFLRFFFRRLSLLDVRSVCNVHYGPSRGISSYFKFFVFSDQFE